MLSRPVRRARREGSLAAIDHCLRGAPAPVNPYPRGSKRALWFDHGAEQAVRFSFPMLD